MNPATIKALQIELAKLRQELAALPPPQWSPSPLSTPPEPTPVFIVYKEWK